jgi:hypothetical protein
MSQDNEAEYFRLTKEADSLFKAKNYKGAAILFSSAFKINGGKGLIPDRYNAGCAWALVNQPDSAFAELERIVTKGTYDDFDLISTDPDLTSLHKDKRWEPMMAIIKENKKKNKEKEK